MKAVFLKSAQAELDAAVDYYADHASDRVAEQQTLSHHAARAGAGSLAAG